MSTVVIIGGHGKVALKLARLLSPTHDVISWIRNADVVVWSAGAGGGSPERTYAVDRDAAIRSIDAAVAATQRPRYIMVSYFGARPNHGVPQDNSFFAYAESKAAADAHLSASGLPAVILGPSGLTDDPGTGRIKTAPGVEASTVSRDDVASVAAYAVDHPQLDGRFIQFNNGAESIEAALSQVASPIVGR